MMPSKVSRYLAFNPEFETNETWMRFRLTYDDRLEGNGSTVHKHEIRRTFHPQLKRLWEAEPNLADWSEWEGHREGPRQKIPAWQHIANLHQRGNYRYVPLARSSDFLLVSLDILFLRPEVPGNVIRSADIDNRLKTLFDGLRMPSSDQELDQRDRMPRNDEEPFFVLLEDDRLISNVSVETDVLLQPTSNSSDQYLPNHARLILTVTLKPYRVLMDNLHFA